MIKLFSLYNEIKLVSNKFPKNKKWEHNVKSYEDFVNLMKILEHLGYEWNGGEKPTKYTPPIIEFTKNKNLKIHNNLGSIYFSSTLVQY